MTTHQPTQHPPIDFEKLEIDPDKLQRALTLTVTPMEHLDRETGELSAMKGCYYVTPVSPEAAKHGIENYAVDLYSPDVPRCTCGDHTFRQVICKHMLACLLYESQSKVVAALAAEIRSLAPKPD